MRLILLLIVFFSTPYPSLSAQDNPFIAMAGKPYASYCEELELSIWKNIDRREPEWIGQTADQMREAARITGSRKWMLEAALLEADYRYHRRVYMQKPNQQQIDLLAEEHINDLTDIVKQARKAGAKEIESRALFSIMWRYTYPMGNYEMAFRAAHELGEALSKISAAEFPHRPVYYFDIARLYYSFREYETTRLYFEKALEDPAIAYRQRVLEKTWNDMGLIYRNYYNDLAASDSCFNRILELDPASPELISYTDGAEVAFSMQKQYELWHSIAKGNLGTNAYLRGEYDEAIPLLRYAVERTPGFNPYNYPYAAGKALALADIYIKENDLPQARLYAGKAYEFLDLSRRNDKIEGVTKDTGLWADYFETLSRYWRTKGDYARALLYADSTRSARTLFEDDFNLHKLHRAEQRIKQEELEAEQQRSEWYRRTICIVTGFAALVFGLLCLVYYYYRKKKAAYRVLVEKAGQWAEMDTLEMITPQSVPDLLEQECSSQEKKETEKINREDKAVIARVHELMAKEQAYKDSSLTLDSLAEKMDIYRSLLSRAINSTTGKNFNRFINEYRVKEAIRIMTSPGKKSIYMDELYEPVGFSSRTSFYRAFKQITGLSPTEYRNNSPTGK
ncbi:AraC family transcriptional regulator [uncultured Alistipes sp.]|jgi:transcriptional regulator|uniref:helix-turn-helix domain-containing protein n=1 Tax=uncultured Alistipes sp. TaxID=538949 RepID=UPI0025FF0CDA|nr:AraC family transcriptional regulator [uncultured Alistipes sp.]